MTCQTGCRSSEKIWSMNVVLQSHEETLRQRIGTLPVLLMNHQWSREQRTTYHSWSLVYRRVLPLHPHLFLQHLHRRILWAAWQIQQQKEVKFWVRRYGETRRMDQQKSKTQQKWRTRRSTKRFIGVQRKLSRWKLSFGAKGSRQFQLFSWITHGVACKSGIGFGPAVCLYALSEGPQLRYLFDDKKITRGLLLKTYWYSRAKSGNVWWLSTADHKVLREGCESRNTHRYAVVVQDLENSVDTILYVSTKKIPRRPSRA